MAAQLSREVELLGCRRAQGHGVCDLLGAPDACAVHAGNDQSEGIAGNSLPHGIIAGLEIGVEGNLEGDLLAAVGLVADGDGVNLGPTVEALGFFVLING
jgi:hypothetical protein